MVKYLQCLLCYFFVCGTVVAQPTFVMSSADVAPGEVFTVQVSAENLESIVSMQYTTVWDPEVITFQEVIDFSIPFLGPGNFGSQDADQGILRMNWFDNSPTSTGLTASSVDLYKLEFRANQGILLADTEISFTSDPVQIEIGDTSLMNIGMIPMSGGVTVLDPNDIESVNQVADIIGQNIPNPFYEDTFIPIELTESKEIKLEIINLTGVQIYEHTEFIHPGLHKINIPGDIFPANGTYLYSVLIGENKVAKKLFYNGK